MSRSFENLFINEFLYFFFFRMVQKNNFIDVLGHLKTFQNIAP